MSMLSKINSNNNNNMNTTPSFHEFKKQASFFLKEKIKSARLALTDVTPTQLLTEEATNGNPWAPDTRILGSISKAAFELDDFWRIVDILHKRFLRFERKNWRVSYNSIIVLEHLLTHGPESVAREFQTDKDVIRQMETFQYIDEKGFNWGLTVRKKSERILTLLEKEHLLKEERDRARKLTRGIRGFGSFCQRNSSAESSHSTFGRSNSEFTDHKPSENDFFSLNEENVMQKDGESDKGRQHNPVSDNNFSVNWMNEKPEISCKENMTPTKAKDLHRWNHTNEDNSLLVERKPKDEITVTEESHPFSAEETETTCSLLSERN